jgi:hypothetical protein
MLLGIHFLYRYRIAYLAPVDGEAIFADISKVSSLNKYVMIRFLGVATS